MTRVGTRPLPLQSRHSKGQTLIGLLIFLLVAGCSPAPDANPAADGAKNQPPQIETRKANSIVAEPNPVPAGPGAGTTKISWKVDPTANAHVLVVGDDGKEIVFAESGGGPGSQDAPWITSDRSYEFRLYTGSGPQRTLLDKVVVTRQK